MICIFDDHAELVNGILSVRRTGRKSYLLTLSKTWAEVTPLPGATQKTRLLMDRVYLALRELDPTLPPPSQVKEEAFGQVPHHAGHRQLGRDAQEHVHMIGHDVSLLYPAFLLLGQTLEHGAKLAS